MPAYLSINKCYNLLYKQERGIMNNSENRYGISKLLMFELSSLSQIHKSYICIQKHQYSFPTRVDHQGLLLAFMTLNRTSWPRLSCPLKNSCSGYVLAMSLLISFSQGEDIFSNSEYWFFTGISVALHRSCQTMARKWWGIPFLISSWEKNKPWQIPSKTLRGNLPVQFFITAQHWTTTVKK